MVAHDVDERAVPNPFPPMKSKSLLFPVIAGLIAGATALLALAPKSASSSGTEKSAAGCGGCCQYPTPAALQSAMPVTPVGTAALTEADKAYLASYEKLRAALAADNLAEAKAAASHVEGAEKVAKADNLGDARKAFVAVSAKALALAKGQAGFYHAHCPMYPGGGDWVQTSKEISNPYWGKTMLRCGTIKE